MKAALYLCLAIIPFFSISGPVLGADKVYKLTVNDHNPAFSGPGKATIYWAEQVNEMSKGRLKLEVHSGGALLNGVEVYRGIQSGICDVGVYVIDVREGFLLNLVMSLPFMGWPEQHKTGQIYQELLDSFEAMRTEWKNVTIIGMMMMPPTHIHMAKTPVKTPSDLKGMKIFGGEVMQTEAVKAAGGTPVLLDIADMAPSFNTGLIDGIITHFPVMNVFGALELVHYHTLFGGGGINMTPIYLVMNTEKLNSLPADLKELILDSGSIYINKFKELDSVMMEGALNDAKKMNHTFINLTPEEIKVWYNLVKVPVHDRWINNAEQKGLPGKAVYEKALDLIKKY